MLAMWQKKTGQIVRPTYGEILACGALKKYNANGKVNKALTRLYRILVAESAYLIWQLRLEHRIKRDGLDPASEQEIHNRWYKQIDLRLELDRQLTNRSKWRKKALPPALVINTWRGVLAKEDTLPADWTNPAAELQVLVGREVTMMG
ncbi:hypothetical protein MIND_01136000 [Mycena indigotica]|uniref:Uncharacterized protein n=1 Tax=Mycena indigotica TaxID=2126181 RepID=A0A8H6S715_9AGAR|nr:uncharacterized protein MIND_01136000 [Mycena indigotica]KAF7293572.1 hypothetical protein MIND_01136000 [Mycena indigotica]